MKDQLISLPVPIFYLCFIGIFIGGFMWGYVIHKIKTKPSERDAEIKRLRAELEKQK